MDGIFDRTEKLLGKDGIEKLRNSSVLLFGLGGVGGYVFEGLLRSGVGRIGVVDGDVFSESNLNRQILATLKTVGLKKTEAALARAGEINPECAVECYDMLFLPENSSEIPFEKYDYVVDAIDTVKGKIEIIKCSTEHGIPVISSMGTGNKTDPGKLTVTDIYKTQNDPLARVMRGELKKAGIKKLKVVYSEEIPSRTVADSSNGRHAPASISYIPAIAGMMIAGEVIRDIIGR